MMTCLRAVESFLSYTLAPLAHVRKRNDGRRRRRLCLDLRDRIERTRSDRVENRFGARLEGGLGSSPAGDRFDLGRSIDARRDHGHPDGVAEIGIEGRADDDVGFSFTSSRIRLAPSSSS